MDEDIQVKKKKMDEDDRITFCRDVHLRNLCKDLASIGTTTGEDALNSVVDTKSKSESCCKKLTSSLDRVKLIQTEVETTVAALLPELSQSCAKMERLFSAIDAMEGTMLRIKYSVASAEKRAKELRRSCDELNGSTLTRFISNILAVDDRSSLEFPEWEPLPSFTKEVAPARADVEEERPCETTTDAEAPQEKS